MGTRAHTVPRFYLRGFLDPLSESNKDPWVWIGDITTGEIKRRSPKNISIVSGLYDGPGGFENLNASLEKHLSNIETAAAFGIRRIAASRVGENLAIPPEVWRFLAWQAARTPGWMRLNAEWVKNELWMSDSVVEPPPDGFDDIEARHRLLLVENPETQERREVSSDAFEEYHLEGWQLILRNDDHLELLHLQAWYFQVRHFPRLSWARLDAPPNEWFVTSDRVVTWLVDGLADTPPAALRDPLAELVAPLTRKTVLFGRNATGKLDVRPEEINRFVASTASEWIAGPTMAIIERTLNDLQEIR